MRAASGATYYRLDIENLRLGDVYSTQACTTYTSLLFSAKKITLITDPSPCHQEEKVAKRIARRSKDQVPD